MTRLALLTAATVALAAGPAAADADRNPDLKKGAPPIKAVSAMAFGPHGTLFVGDPQSATIFAVRTGDTKPGPMTDVSVDDLGEKLGSALGTTAANVAVADVKVNPASGSVYLAVTRGKGKDAAPVIVKLDRAGKLEAVDLSNVPFAQVALPNATDKQRAEAITNIAYVEGKVLVAGLSSEEFASTLRVIPYPFQSADKGTGVEIYHGAHGKLETRSPVRTFVPYTVSGTDYLLAAYTCTPLVKFPVADLKPGEKVRGTTIAELGNGNRPLDMIVYTKDGKDYILMANSNRGVMKIPTEGVGTAEPITARPKGATAGVKYETVKAAANGVKLEAGVMQLDRLDADRAVVLIQAKDGPLSLRSIPLP